MLSEDSLDIDSQEDFDRIARIYKCIKKINFIILQSSVISIAYVSITIVPYFF